MGRFCVTANGTHDTSDKMEHKLTGFKVIGFAREFDGETAYVEIPKFWDEIGEKYANSVWKGNAPTNPDIEFPGRVNIEWYGDGDPRPWELMMIMRKFIYNHF